MPRVSGTLRPLIVGLSVIVILLVVVPRNSSAQTTGSLTLGEVTHSADGTTVATLSGAAEELASLEVSIDGASVPFEVSDSPSSTASRVIFAVENSVSMTPAQLFEVQTAMGALVASLGAADEVGIVTFGGGASVALPATTDRAAFDTALSAITLDGGSALYSGVATAGELAAGSGQSLIVLVTYGWDWGSLSTHSREASLTAVADAGASVYVQSMVFDGSVDIAYLAPLATEGFVRDATQVAAIAGATSLIGVSEPARTLTVTAPALALGEHALQVSSSTGAAQLATFEVTNDGLLALAVTPGAEATDALTVQVTSAAALSSFEVTATLGGTALDIASDGSTTVDPWALAPGSATIEVNASVDGELAGSATRSVTIPTLSPTLTVDQSNDQVLGATLLAQPGTADTLVAVVDGATVAESATGTLEVDRPAAGTLTFEARALGQVVTSEEISATTIVEPVTTEPPPVAETDGSSSILTSPVMLAIPAALMLLALVLGRRGWPPFGGKTRVEDDLGSDEADEAREAAPAPEPIPLSARREAPLASVRAAPATPAREVAPAPAPETPTPIRAEEAAAPPAETAPAKSRLGMFDRRAKNRPTPIHPSQWVVVVRAPDGEMRRVEVGYEPVSIGASKLCTVTLDGDTVRFVHLVVAREGHDVKAHQFGPVAVNGQDQNVEDEATLTNSVMEIGDVAIWLERSAAESAAVDAA